MLFLLLIITLNINIHQHRDSSLNTTQTIFFLSDVHLGEHEKHRERIKEQRLFSFLDHVHREKGKLIICGDLFDFWFEYRHAIPKRHFQILHRLKLLTDSGIEVHYLAGNHDLWIAGFFEQQIGIQVHADEFSANIGNKKLYVRHGDGLMKSDVGYRLLKRVIRHPVNIFLFRLLHPDFGIPLALLSSHRSRVTSSVKEGYTDSDYRIFAEKKINEGFDFVVLGHTHVAALQNFANGWYINPGDWMFNFTYATIEMDVPALFSWDGSGGQPFQPLDLH